MLKKIPDKPILAFSGLALGIVGITNIRESADWKSPCALLGFALIGLGAIALLKAAQ